MSRSASAAGALIVVAGLTGCATAQPPAPSPSPVPSPTAGTADYRDGTYAATGWYGSLPSHQDVTLTIENDLVTDVAVTTPAEDPTSLSHQQHFADAIGDAVIGLDIDTIALDRLAGASGCSEGFMNALAEIKTAART